MLGQRFVDHGCSAGEVARGMTRWALAICPEHQRGLGPMWRLRRKRLAPLAPLVDGGRRRLGFPWSFIPHPIALLSYGVRQLPWQQSCRRGRRRACGASL